MRPARGGGEPASDLRDAAALRDPARPSPATGSGLGDLARRAGEFLARLGLALTALCLGVVTLVCALSTVWLMVDKDGNLTQSMSLYTLFDARNAPVLLAGLAAAVLVLGICAEVRRRAVALDGRRAAVALLVGALVVQVAMVAALRTSDTYWGDSWMIDDFVDKALSGGIQSLFEGPYKTLYYDARLYFSAYPFQASFFWLMYGLHRVFGVGGYAAFQLLNVAGNELAVASLLVLGRELCPSAGSRRVLWVLVAACLPMYWLAAFVYGNALGCGLALAFLACQARAMRGLRPGGGFWPAAVPVAAAPVAGPSAAAAPDGAVGLARTRALGAGALTGVRAACERVGLDAGRRATLGWIALSVVPLTLALCIKATFVLFAIGAVLAWAVVGLARRRALPLVACVAVLMVANGLAGLPFAALERASGGYEFGEPLTTLNHLELGLREGSNDAYLSIDGADPTYVPGWYGTHAVALWAESGMYASVQNARAAGYLAADVVGFAADPAYAAWFFSAKLAAEWADPTYQSLYYLSMCAGPGGVRPNPADLATPLGLGCTALTFLLDGYQTVAFPAAAGCVLMARRRWKRACGERAGCPAAGEAGADVPSGPDPLVTVLLAATFFAGFGCYLLWETKAVYVLPYAIVALPLSAVGLDAFLGWLDRR